MGNFNGLTIDDVLYNKIGKKNLEIYLNALDYHYYMWKYHRHCDFGTLKFLRQILYKNKISILLKDPAWRIDRSLNEYNKVLDINIENHIANAINDFSGTKNIFKPFRFLDEGPGAGIALYEAVAAHSIGSAEADSLYFSIDGTLKNCLKEEFRVNSENELEAYRSEKFYSTLKEIEIASVFIFLLKRDVAFNEEISCEFDKPLNILLPNKKMISSKISQSKLYDVTEATKILLNKYQSHIKLNSESGIKSILFGYLIDEMIARFTIPNGMKFWYKLASKNLELLINEYKPISKCLKNNGIFSNSLLSELKTLHHDSLQFENKLETQTYDKTWLLNIKKVADILRSTGIYERKFNNTNSDELGLVFDCSNYLWRWAFFIEQKEIFDNTQDIDQVITTIYSWLRRPWGILDREDIILAFNGIISNNADETQQMFIAFFSNLFTMEIEVSLIHEFEFKEISVGVDALRKLIYNRYYLHLLHKSVSKIENDLNYNTEKIKAINLIIDLLIMWVYDQEYPNRFREVDVDIYSLIELLNNGKWLKEIINKEETIISKSQKKRIDEYVNHPEQFINQIFQFNNKNFDISEGIDTFPPEEFQFLTLI